MYIYLHVYMYIYSHVCACCTFGSSNLRAGRAGAPSSRTAYIQTIQDPKSVVFKIVVVNILPLKMRAPIFVIQVSVIDLLCLYICGVVFLKSTISCQVFVY